MTNKPVLKKINQRLIDEGLPDCLESERAVLSILINNNTAIEILTEHAIGKSHFNSPVNQDIYETCQVLVDEGYNLEALAVIEKLRKKYDEKRIREIVIGLMEANYLLGDFRFHLDNLKLYLRKRELILHSCSMIEVAYNDSQLPVEGHADSLAEEIKGWIVNTTGEFNINEIDRELNLIDKKTKNNRRVILQRLVQDGIIEQVGKRTGNYRKIEKEDNEIAWQQANTEGQINLKLPFDIDTLCYIFPKNIIVIGGEKDSGKTAFLLNIVRNNMNEHEIIYLSSEMMEIELASRIEKFENIKLNEWKFKALECSDNFQDYIKPEAINLIDYLEVSDEFWKVNEKIRKIYDKLTTGIAIIGIQKKKGAEYARGAEFSLEKARLYITLQAGSLDAPSELKIISAKNPKGEKPPRGKIIKYKLVQGCKFVPEPDGGFQTDHNRKLLIKNSKQFEEERQYKE